MAEANIFQSTITSPFVFFIHVSKRYGKCLRSNNVFLLLLPCPQPVFDMLCTLSVSLRLLLLMGGDIEPNPGPDPSIAEQLKLIATDIQDIKKGKTVTNQKLNSIEKKLEKLGHLEKQVSNCVKKVTELEQQLSIMTKKVDDLENRSPRSNLIVFGIKEQEDETTETLHTVVTNDILKDKLDLTISGIQRIHRLGCRKADNEGKVRPVIFKLQDYRDKENVLQNCSKLKGSGYSISEDLSRYVRDVRKKLWNRTKENRDRKEKVRLMYDKVRINGRLFAWNNDSDDIIELTPKNEEETNAEPRSTRSR
ncbi:uncharacterized protein [Dermacentor andersoni]|uniref:uncharacterized protein n=1 Tax=Dermacentor andersoni TaxID=34620 RepID=UPI003B3A1708